MLKKQTSKAMKAYLERARAHNEFMEKKNVEFQIGKRHLANMMGENPDTFTQEDINVCIIGYALFYKLFKVLLFYIVRY